MRFIYTRTFRRFFAIFLAVGLFIIFDKLGYLNGIKNVFLKIYGTGSVTVRSGVVKTKEFVSLFIAIKKLAYESAQQRKRIDELSFENARLQSAKQENSALRKALNFQQQTTLNLLPVEVVSFDPTGFSRAVVIKAPKSVPVGKPVVSTPGLLAGKISRVYGDMAEVTLITDPAIIINAEVADSGAKGLVKGSHGLSLLFDLLTQNELVKVGDLVITSGLTEDFPRGLLIGSIVAIRSSTSELFQKASISPAADLRNLRFLFVIE